MSDQESNKPQNNGLPRGIPSTSSEMTPDMIDKMTQAADALSANSSKTRLEKQMADYGMGISEPPLQSGMPPANPIQHNPPPANPLSGYFRSPGMNVSLPSMGKFNKPEEIKFTINKEVPVYSMTAKDEIIMKSPDALLNGNAIEQVIKSCAPSILNVRDLPVPDVDVLMMAIRASTYGDIMPVEATCPACKTDNEFEINVRHLVENISYIDDVLEEEFEHFIVKMRPYTFESNVKISLIAFEENKLLQNLANSKNVEASELSVFGDTFNRVGNLTNELVANSITSVIVRANNQHVTEYRFIKEWIDNADASIVEKLKNKLQSINDFGIEKNVDAKCAACEHKWKTIINFDPSSFFDHNS